MTCQEINTIEQDGRCPFCQENFKYHKEPILQEEKNWFVTKNSWPYENTKYHFIIIGKTHKENFQELTAEDFKEVLTLVNWIIAEYKIKGGAITLRFGDTDHTGATVCHLHFHLISY